MAAAAVTKKKKRTEAQTRLTPTLSQTPKQIKPPE